jgi:hypothetical protein
MMSYASAETTLKTCAIFRIIGDLLDPDEITAILKRSPTAAHRKEQEYYMGKNAEFVRGRTGVWMLSTDRIIKSNNFSDHLSAILAVLALDQVEQMLGDHARPLLSRLFRFERPMPGFLLSGQLGRLKSLMETKNLKADLRCVWFGTPGATEPVIPAWVHALFDAIPIVIEKNFDTQGEEALSA